MSSSSCSLGVGQMVWTKYASSTLRAYQKSQGPCWWSWLINKDDYIKKLNGIIDDGIKHMKYVETADDTCNELKRFQNFLYLHFYKHEYYEEMRPRSNQPGQSFATAKTHKFKCISDVTLEQLKLRSIIDQTGTYIYKASKVVAEYLGPLAKNDYTIRDALSFPDLLKSAPSDHKYKDVSYDVKSLFTSIPVQETIDYVLYKIYDKKELKPFCKMSIFKKLWNKLTKKCIFSANDRLTKQIYGCPIGGPISVILSDTYGCKIVEDIVTPSKPLFYKRYMECRYVKTKKNETLQCVELVPPKYKIDFRITTQV